MGNNEDFATAFGRSSAHSDSDSVSILNVQAQAVSKELSSPGAKGGLVKDQVDWPTFLAP